MELENSEAEKYIELLKSAIKDRDAQIARMAVVVEKAFNNFKDMKELLDERTEQLNKTLEMGKSLAEIADKAIKGTR
jgi:D-serine dehydratase